MDTLFTPRKGCLELLWANPAQMSVSAGSIVEAIDVFRNVLGSELARLVDVLLDSLLLQAAEEGFGDGVVPAVALATHARHSQRPNLSYGETKIFDKYFETLFKNKDYAPENVFALNAWMNEMLETWVSANPLNLNETLLAMRAYAPYHHLYVVGMCLSIGNNQSEKVASPSKSYATAARAGMVSELVKVAEISLNMALEAAANEPQPANRVFSPQNWVKTKGCLAGVNGAIRNYFNMLPMMPGGGDIKNKLAAATQLRPEDFEYRWSAD